MAEKIIPVMLLSWETVAKVGRRLRGLGKLLTKLTPALGATLSKIGIEVGPEAYAVGSLLSSFFYGLLFFVIALVLMFLRSDAETGLNIALQLGIALWLMFFTLHMFYPPIILKKIAAKENKDLLFALREIMIDVNSGIPLFEALKNAAHAGYGYISRDFYEVTREIESGESEREALKKLAVRTESEYLKRSVWQMVNALETGAALGSALSGIVHSIEGYVYRDIKNYTSNLNFLMLIYLFAAAVVPSLGVTFLVLLSAFSDFGVTVDTVSLLVLASAILQLVLMGFMGSTRPEIFGG